MFDTTNPCSWCGCWTWEEDEDFPTCKYMGDPEYAPCAIEEDYPSDDPAIWEEEDDDYDPVLAREVFEDMMQ